MSNVPHLTNPILFETLQLKYCYWKRWYNKIILTHFYLFSRIIKIWIYNYWGSPFLRLRFICDHVFICNHVFGRYTSVPCTWYMLVQLSKNLKAVFAIQDPILFSRKVVGVTQKQIHLFCVSWGFLFNFDIL